MVGDRALRPSSQGDKLVDAQSLGQDFLPLPQATKDNFGLTRLSSSPLPIPVPQRKDPGQNTPSV